MTLRDFLELHEGGCACNCVSISEQSGCQFCEEESQDYILKSEWFKKIADKEVVRFCVIGGGIYKVELCIEIQENK